VAHCTASVRRLGALSPGDTRRGVEGEGRRGRSGAEWSGNPVLAHRLGPSSPSGCEARFAGVAPREYVIPAKAKDTRPHPFGCTLSPGDTRRGVEGEGRIDRSRAEGCGGPEHTRNKTGPPLPPWDPLRDAMRDPEGQPREGGRRGTAGPSGVLTCTAPEVRRRRRCREAGQSQGGEGSCGIDIASSPVLEFN